LVVVAHRADLLRLADRVVSLGRDRVPMVGSPDKILGLDSRLSITAMASTRAFA
jgi:ABC-type bacteriocin/lantibiotic exporter with double-glycine peptidase domain